MHNVMQWRLFSSIIIPWIHITACPTKGVRPAPFSSLIRHLPSPPHLTIMRRFCEEDLFFFFFLEVSSDHNAMWSTTSNVTSRTESSARKDVRCGYVQSYFNSHVEKKWIRLKSVTDNQDMNWFSFSVHTSVLLENHSLCYIGWFRVNLIKALVQMCMSNVADKSNVVLSFGRSFSWMDTFFLLLLLAWSCLFADLLALEMTVS